MTKFLSKSLWLLFYVITFIGLVSGGVLKVPVGKTPALIQPVVSFFHYWGWLVIPSCFVLCPILAGLRKKLRNWAFKKTGFDSLLQQARHFAFSDQKIQGQDLHRFRATLFLPKRDFLFFWQERLVIVSRSCYQTQDSKTKFKITDDPKKCEGIAGKAYGGQTVFVDDLPAITSASSLEEIQDYAEKTNVTIEWVQHRLNQGKELARSYLGVPLEVNGKRKGVLIFDSAKTRFIRYNNKGGKDQAACRFIALAFAQKLERFEL